MLDQFRFFIDRGMGSRVVPLGLRAAGWRVETMDERYGPNRSQAIPDVEWIRDAVSAGDLILAKDRAIAKRPLEAEVIRDTAARAFVIASAQITGPEMLERLLRNEAAIEAAASDRGPFVLGVDVARLHRIRLAD